MLLLPLLPPFLFPSSFFPFPLSSPRTNRQLSESIFHCDEWEGGGRSVSPYLLPPSPAAAAAVRERDRRKKEGKGEVALLSN